MQLPTFVTKNTVNTRGESIVNLFQTFTLKGMAVAVKAKRVLKRYLLKSLHK